VQQPPPSSSIERVTSHRVLGVIVNNKMTASDHVDYMLSSCSSLLYALRVLRNHGVPPASLHDVLRATIVAQLTYCAPAWSGGCSAADRTRLDSFINRCRRLGYCKPDTPSITDLFTDADDTFFARIFNNTHHILQQYLPERSQSQYNLRDRSHHKTLINKTVYLNEQDFIIPMIYRDCY